MALKIKIEGPREESSEGDEFVFDFSRYELRQDHEQRPFWVCPNRRVFLETFSPSYVQARDFLIAIADPVTRPRHIHEYKITHYSLYAAASLGLRTSDILSGIDRMSKTIIGKSLRDFIQKTTSEAGKVRLLLRSSRYFLESSHRAMLKKLLQDQQIREARVDGKGSAFLEEDRQIVKIRLEGTKDGGQSMRQAMGLVPDKDSAPGGNHTAFPEPQDLKVVSFEIKQTHVENVRKACQRLKTPILEEYDFHMDEKTANLPINLRPKAMIRPYQEKSLSKMFGNGRARSGIIVLPCGAGKTLVGITACSTVHKSTLVFCTTAVAVDQWRRQFLQWTTVEKKRVIMFTSGEKRTWDKDEAVIVITTYSMVGYGGQRAREAEKIMQLIRSQEWGLILLDEVHVAPAEKFKKCVTATHSRCKLGLTATLVREDKKIENLFYLIGPKLYEANWLDLVEQGFLARVLCLEVRCPMTSKFYNAYLERDDEKNMQRLLYWMNPHKLRACERLIRFHEKRGDKVLVFSDNIYTLRTYAELIKCACVHGSVPTSERLKLLEMFQKDDSLNTLFISKVGDNSIDLPDVNVIIQISSHYAQRRQEAQRLGRILRPKDITEDKFNAYFYTLISQDTKEVLYATKRQRFLVDQGYSYMAVDVEKILGQEPAANCELKIDEADLLKDVLSQDPSVAQEERDENDQGRSKVARPKPQRKPRRPGKRQAEADSAASGKTHQWVGFLSGMSDNTKVECRSFMKMIVSTFYEPQYYVIVDNLIAMGDGGALGRDLAKRMGLDTPTVRKLLRKLVRDKLLREHTLQKEESASPRRGGRVYAVNSRYTRTKYEKNRPVRYYIDYDLVLKSVKYKNKLVRKAISTPQHKQVKWTCSNPTCSVKGQHYTEIDLLGLTASDGRFRCKQTSCKVVEKDGIQRGSLLVQVEMTEDEHKSPKQVMEAYVKQITPILNKLGRVEKFIQHERAREKNEMEFEERAKNAASSSAANRRNGRRTRAEREPSKMQREAREAKEAEKRIHAEIYNAQWTKLRKRVDEKETRGDGKTGSGSVGGQNALAVGEQSVLVTVGGKQVPIEIAEVADMTDAEYKRFVDITQHSTDEFADLSQFLQQRGAA